MRNTLNAPLLVNNEELNSNAFNLNSRGMNIGHLNIQGICGEKLGKFSELKVLLTLPENNNLHILGLSETKLKDHKSTDVFKINGFQTPFRRDNDSNGGGGLLVYVKNGINARRREDLETHNLRVRNTLNAPLLVNNEELNSNAFNLNSRGMNIGHLNIQGICGEKLGKFSELKVLLTLPENNNLHILGLSETKLKDHKSTDVFKINGFQTPFRRDNDSNGGGGLLVYVKNGINARRREDLETHDISCIWLEISPPKSKSFLVGNMYRPPDSRVEYNDRFEEFIDSLIDENKEFILLGDFNKDLLNLETDREWGNFTTSLGLTQLVNEPTRVTNASQTIIDHIYTNTEENIQRVHVERLCLSDHYAVFCNRKTQ